RTAEAGLEYPNVATLVESMVSCNEGARLCRRLHDDARLRHARDDPIPLGKSVFAYLFAGRIFREEQTAAIQYLSRKPPIARRIDAIDPAGQDGAGGAPRGS